MAGRYSFALCTGFALCALLGSVCAGESKLKSVLFQESFNDAKLKDRKWYDMTRISIVGGAAAGEGCIEYDWPDKNSKGTASGAMRHLFAPTDKVHIRFYLKLSKGWGWTGRNYHPHLVHFMTTENRKWHGPAASHLTLYIEPVNGKLRLAAQDIQNKDMPYGLTQGPLKGGYNGKFYESKDILFKDDKWHCIEAFFKLNTLDVEKDRPNKDGTILGWFDGKLVISQTNVILRSTDFPTMKFNHFLMAPYFGPGLLPLAQKLWIDELVVSTRRIGPLPKRSNKKSWTSSLYPPDWTPAFTDEKGRFLHDFSYAGYGQGRSIPSVRGRVFDVTKYGADRSGKKDATKSIQDAIDGACRKGGIVRFPSGTFRVDDILTVNRPGVVLRGAGADKTRLWFSSAEGENRKSHLLVTGKIKRTPLRSLAKDGAPRDCSVTLTDVTGLKRGDEIAIGIVNNEAFRKDHGMEKYWRFSAGKWRPLFRRTIRAVDRRSRSVSFTVPLRYHVKVRWGAALAAESGYIANVGIESMAVSNASSWTAAWKTNQVAIIELADAKDCWMKGVSSYAAEVEGSEQAHLQSCGIRVRNAKNITIADCAMFDPAHRGGGGNGYLFEIRSSNEILTRDCIAMRGRHNFIQNWDFGTSGCVWLRIHSDEGEAFLSSKIPIGYPAMSEYHHALSMANLVDCSRIDDGW